MENATGKMQEVFAYIETRREAYLEELFPLLRVPSLSHDRESVRRCAEMLAELMRRMGVRTQIYPTEGNPIVYGELGDRRDVPTLLVYGHYDVQPPDPLDLWTTPPFEPVIRDGRIFGRGTADDKGQFFANLKGIEAYCRIVGELPVRLKFLYEGEEEVSSPSLKPFVEAHRELLAGDILFGSDSHVHESGIPRLNLGNKGMLYVEIRLRGANRDLHSQMAPMVPNPIWRMVGLLGTLKGEDGRVRIEGFYDNVRPPLESELEAVRRIPYDKQAILKDLGLQRLVENRTGDHFYYNQIFEPTANIAGIVGGFTGPDKKTVLPSRVAVKMDLRLVPNQRSEEILEKLRGHLARHGYEDAEVLVLGTAEPNRVPMDHPYIPLFRQAIAEVWGAEPIICPNVGGTNPNWIFAEALGMKDFKVPLALADENAHAPNENFPVECMLKGMKLTANLLNKFAAAAVGERAARQASTGDAAISELLSLGNLHTHFPTRDGLVRAVNGISLSLERGRILGLVGESGCGKSLTALSILRLVPPPGRITADHVRLEGRDLLHASEREMREIRGGRIAIILQNPMTSLNPVYTVGQHLVRVIGRHSRASRSETWRRAGEVLDLVSIPRDRLRSYPHELSGGMRQRVCIGLGVACHPSLLIADEPTTALDVTIQAQILQLLRDIRRRLETSVLLITHDLGVVAELCDTVAVMYAGRIVERAEVGMLFSRPLHPYTRGLLRAIPKPDEEEESLEAIPGTVPNPLDFPPGCPFHPRCPDAVPRCAEQEPDFVERAPGHWAACWQIAAVGREARG